MYNLQLTAEEVKERLQRVQRLSADAAVHSANYDSSAKLIRVDLGYTLEDGAEVKFKSPVDGTSTTGLIVYYPDASDTVVSSEFAFSDAHGNNVGEVDHLFAENAVVKVILDLDTNKAFVQNADTNAYIENTFIKTINGQSPDTTGDVSITINSDQADWSASEGEPGHVLNRTHYIEKESVEILFQKTLDASAGYDVIWDAGSIEIVPSKKYSVLWNGVEYEVESQSADDAVAVLENNVFQIIKGYDPAAASEADKWFITVMPKDDSTEVILSIYQYTEIVHTLDPKYIKDMYYTEGGRVEVLAETSFTVPESADGMYTLDTTVPFEIGKTYIVNWSGTEYTCVGYDASILEAGAVAVGNLSYQGLSGNGEPFALAYIPGQVGTAIICINPNNGAPVSGEFTVSIYHDAETVHKLDNKYLNLDWLPVCKEKPATIFEDTVRLGTGRVKAYDVPPFSIVVGKKYSVAWNDKVYEVIAKRQDASYDGSQVICTYLGNASVVNLNYDGFVKEDTGEEFCILMSPLTGFYIYGTVKESDNTITVAEYALVPNKLPKEYLPDGVPYCIDGGAVEILPECQPTVDPEEGFFFIESGVLDFEVGAKYTINWNGAEYTCECMDSASIGEAGGFVMGNVYALSGGQVGANTGEPFVIIVFMGQMMIFPVDGATELTLSIYQGGAEIRKLDGRCLPSGVPYIEGEGTTKTVLAETTFTDVTSPIQQSMSVTFVEGETYFVNWNGTEYTCTGYIPSGVNAVLIGNARLSVYGEDTGEPFCMGGLEGQFIIWYNDGSTSVTVSIEQDGTVFHKIDERLLPEIEYVNNNLVNGSANGSLRSIGSMEEDSEYTIGEDAFAEGYRTKASGNHSHAEGYDTIASGGGSHAEGYQSNASGGNSHAEGNATNATNSGAHAEGSMTYATGTYSHAEGWCTKASGNHSHAEGEETEANGDISHAEGCGTIANKNQHAQGKYNISLSSSNYAHIVGNGENKINRSNAHTLDWDGNAWFAGDVYVGSTSGTNKDGGSQKLATEKYVSDTVTSTGVNSIVLKSLTEGSNKRFKLTVDDTGTLTVTEI